MTEEENTPATKSPKEKSSLVWLVFLMILLLVAAVGVAGYFGYQNNILVKQTMAPGQTEEAELAESVPTGGPTVAPTLAPTGSTTESLDETWNLYTNYGLGFSVKFPKTSTGGAPCVFENGSYRPATGLVPVKVFEESSGVFLAHEYRFDLTGETIVDGVYNYSACNKRENTLNYLQSESPRTWHIVSQPITSDADLTTFIKAQFQPACNLGEKTVSIQPGVFDVKVLGDGKEPGESECFLNYMYVLKYSPEKQRVWKWDLGQASTFYTANFASEYDTEMKNSFKAL